MNTAERGRPDPPVGKAYILGLPVEMLRQILENLEYAVPDDADAASDAAQIAKHESIENIKNCPLVCKQFHDQSSHMLLRAVEISCLPSSIQRFHEISRHPTIRNGIQTVNVSLRLYQSELAEDINTFVQQFADEFFDLFTFTGWQGRDTDLELIRIEKARAIWDVWVRSYDPDAWYYHSQSEGAENEDDWEADNCYQALIEGIYHEYRRRFEEQESAIRSGEFVRAVAWGMARMPLARTLRFGDGESSSNPGDSAFHRLDPFQDYRFACVFNHSEQDVGDALSQCLLTMRTGRDNSGLCPSQPLRPVADVVVHLLAAIADAGSRPTAIEISLGLYPLAGLAVTSQEMRESLCLVGEELKVFKFDCTDEYWLNERETDAASRCESRMDDMNEVLTACLQSSTKLQSLALSIDSYEGYLYNLDHDVEELELIWNNLAPTLTSRTWKKLKHARLDGLRLSLSELASFVRNLPSSPHGVSLRFENMTLTTGTWAEALRILREESSAAVEFGAMKATGMIDREVAGWVEDMFAAKDASGREVVKRYVNDRADNVEIRSRTVREHPTRCE